jgi:fumarylacetoacetase
MTYGVDRTHALALKSWVESANSEATDFPIQNLPFGRFRRLAGEPWRIGVAIGECVLDLEAAGLIKARSMHSLMAAGSEYRSALRAVISQGLRHGGASRSVFKAALHRQLDVEMGLPCGIDDQADAVAGAIGAPKIGTLFRPENPLQPDPKWIPVNGKYRTASIAVGGGIVRRPSGRITAGADAPASGAMQRLDYELGLAYLIGEGEVPGESNPIARDEAQLFGVALFSDWSASMIPSLQYLPPGPSRHFCSTISPWVVTMEALAPFRAPDVRPASGAAARGRVEPLADRAQEPPGVRLEVWLQTAAMHSAGKPGVRLSTVDSRAAGLWRAARTGSVIDRRPSGSQPNTPPDRAPPSFLADGDRLYFRGWCERKGARRIGFGECTATVAPAPRPIERQDSSHRMAESTTGSPA